MRRWRGKASSGFVSPQAQHRRVTVLVAVDQRQHRVRALVGAPHHDLQLAGEVVERDDGGDRDEEAGAIAFSRFDVVDDATLAQRVSLADRILAVLADGDMKEDQIADLVDASPKVVQSTLNRMGRDRMKAGRQPLVERLPSSGAWHRIPWKEAAS